MMLSIVVNKINATHLDDKPIAFQGILTLLQAVNYIYKAEMS